MQHVVDTYECEWKNAVEDPEKRKRFTHFVNSDAGDPTVKFDDLRGQITPKIEKVASLVEAEA